ncbi:MAG: Mbeg1-like protein [Coprobacillus cateniformis]
MYAGCFIDSEIQKRITQIYNYDGPGFQDEIMLSSEYKNMLPIIQSYIPHYSFFGIVLGHEENYHVVHSHYTGMLQHNGFSWEVGPYHFVEDELSCESVNFAIKVLLFLEKLSNEDKHLFVDSMFKLFDTLNLYTFSDLSHISYKHILGAIKELTLLDSKVRKMLIEVLHMLWLEAKKTKPE